MSLDSRPGDPPTLVSLPYDVKVEILNYLLLSDEPLDVWPGRTPHELYPQILATCKALHEDGSRVLYSRNSIVFSDQGRTSRHIEQWARQIGVINLAHLSRLDLSSLRFYVVIDNFAPNLLAVSFDDVKTWIQCFATLRTHAISLRHLVAVSWGYSEGKESSVAIYQAILVECIVAMKQLETVTLKGGLPHFWVGYLRDKMQASVDTSEYEKGPVVLQDIFQSISVKMADLRLQIPESDKDATKWMKKVVAWNEADAKIGNGGALDLPTGRPQNVGSALAATNSTNSHSTRSQTPGSRGLEIFRMWRALFAEERLSVVKRKKKELELHSLSFDYLIQFK